jgi:Ca2+-binding RTX toxin-like protein
MFFSFDDDSEVRGITRLHYTGSDFVDNIDGGVGDDVLAGGGGNDVLRGWNGDDRIRGGAGSDSIS